jgi:hypothetical protein
MTNDITDCYGQIKAIAEATEGTPTQKLLAILAFVGVEKTADLMRVTGLKERAIQTAKRSVVRPATECATPHSIAVNPQLNAPRPATECALPQLNAGRARVEDNNKLTNLETTVEIKESKILLRSAEPKPKKQVHGTRLDLDWTLSDDLRQWTRTTFPQTTPDRLAAELETFRDYWASVAGQKGRKADWDATWRNWSRRAFATAPLRPNAQPPPMSASAARTARMRAMLREGSPA